MPYEDQGAIVVDVKEDTDTKESATVHDSEIRRSVPVHYHRPGYHL